MLGSVMEHLWKATREKLLSGRNNFVKMKMICYAMRGMVEMKKKGKKNHFIIMFLLFSLPAPPFKW